MSLFWLFFGTICGAVYGMDVALYSLWFTYESELESQEKEFENNTQQKKRKQTTFSTFGKSVVIPALIKGLGMGILLGFISSVLYTVFERETISDYPTIQIIVGGFVLAAFGGPVILQLIGMWVGYNKGGTKWLVESLSDAVWNYELVSVEVMGSMGAIGALTGAVLAAVFLPTSN
eukprot:gb/GECH01000074.1/.p1 GENE.gb/GECH01000074.1/~~gb/GECH01000074.1/.p1  ORF type:complete len:176 (+),score=39.86 gb/GECH01000074.1/:1-528(+)